MFVPEGPGLADLPSIWTLGVSTGFGIKARRASDVSLGDGDHRRVRRGSHCGPDSGERGETIGEGPMVEDSTSTFSLAVEVMEDGETGRPKEVVVGERRHRFTPPSPVRRQAAPRPVCFGDRQGPDDSRDVDPCGYCVGGELSGDEGGEEGRWGSVAESGVPSSDSGRAVSIPDVPEGVSEVVSALQGSGRGRAASAVRRVGLMITERRP